MCVSPPRAVVLLLAVVKRVPGEARGALVEHLVALIVLPGGIPPLPFFVSVAAVEDVQDF